MSETKFTPGPWRLADHSYTFIISKPGDGYITRDVCRMDASTMSAFQQKANAHLIAAAPELYEALEELHAQQNGPPLEKYKTRWEKAMRKTEAALAKARGEE
jgi:hypothetical protein